MEDFRVNVPEQCGEWKRGEEDVEKKTLRFSLEVPWMDGIRNGYTRETAR